MNTDLYVLRCIHSLSDGSMNPYENITTRKNCMTRIRILYNISFSCIDSYRNL